nr:hypothetical protein [Burkholderiales bacterium]
MLTTLKSLLSGVALTAALVAPSAHAVDIGQIKDLGVVTSLVAEQVDLSPIPRGKSFAEYIVFETIAPFDVEWAVTANGVTLLNTQKLWTALFKYEPGFDIASVTDGMGKPAFLAGPSSEPSLLMGALMDTLDLEFVASAPGNSILAVEGLAPGKYLFAVSGLVPQTSRFGGAFGGVTVFAVPEPST